MNKNASLFPLHLICISLSTEFFKPDIHCTPPLSHPKSKYYFSREHK